MAYDIWVLDDYGIEAVSEFADRVPVRFLYDDGPYDVVAKPVDVAVARRWKFVLPLDNDERAAVLEFLRDDLSFGTEPFLFMDGRDVQETALALGTGDGVATVFALPTTRSSLAYGHYPLNDASTVVKVAGTPVATGDRTIQVDARTVTLLSPPTLGQAVTLDYNYYRLCRIVQDSIDWKGITSVWQTSEIEVEEVLR